jgi:hypothetical protein
MTNREDTRAHFFMLVKVDDQVIDNSWSNTRRNNAGQGMVFYPYILTREVLPKEQTFTIHGLVFFPTDAQALFGDDMGVIHEFTFSPVAGETYTVKGELLEEGSKVWLEDSAGHVVEGSLGQGS